MSNNQKYKIASSNENMLYDDFESIVINDIELIDVRAPIEFKKGSFPNSINLPLMDDEQRHLIGIKYKCDGAEKAIEFANSKLVTEEIKNSRINSWKNYINKVENENKYKPLLFCFRGGMRSKISQKWIKDELDYNIPRILGGYKAFRNYLINQLMPSKQISKPIIIAGYTGSAKTVILKEFKNSIDLEKIANHRGSAFGSMIDEQPSQISFENKLAYSLIKHRNSKYKYLIIEDEGRHIGASFFPQDLFEYLKSGDYIFIESDVETRARHILEDYIDAAQKDFVNLYKKDGLQLWYEKAHIDLKKIRKRLGIQLYEEVQTSLTKMYEEQIKNNSTEVYLPIVKLLLENYYDKMYEHQTRVKNKNIVFSGSYEEVKEYIQKNYSF